MIKTILNSLADSFFCLMFTTCVATALALSTAPMFTHHAWWHAVFAFPFILPEPDYLIVPDFIFVEKCEKMLKNVNRNVKKLKK